MVDIDNSKQTYRLEVFNADRDMWNAHIEQGSLEECLVEFLRIQRLRSIHLTQVRLIWKGMNIDF